MPFREWQAEGHTGCKESGTVSAAEPPQNYIAEDRQTKRKINKNKINKKKKRK